MIAAPADHPAVVAVAAQVGRDLGAALSPEESVLAAQAAVGEVLASAPDAPLPQIVAAALALIRGEGPEQ